MRKLVTLAVALTLATASAAALADGNAFVNANAGYSSYNINKPVASDGETINQRKGDPAGAIRVGYRWNSVVDYGVEVGYGYLGQYRLNQSTDDGYAQRLTQKNRGFLLGGNLNYNITENWYIAARAGWFRGRNTYTNVSYDPDGSSITHRGTATNTGEYFGVGGGYNFNKNFSVGLAYDTYHTPGSPLRSSNPFINGAEVRGTRAGMYSIQGEYRF